MIDTYIVQSQAEAQEGAELFFFLNALYRLSPTHKTKPISAALFILWFRLVTIARAIELKHNAGLIAALAFETANYYQKAGGLELNTDNNREFLLFPGE